MAEVDLMTRNRRSPRDASHPGVDAGSTLRVRELATRLLAMIFGIIIVSVIQAAFRLETVGTIQPVQTYVGVVVLVLGIMIATMGIVAYVKRRPPRVEKIKRELTTIYLDALDASELNPSRSGKIGRG